MRTSPTKRVSGRKVQQVKKALRERIKQIEEGTAHVRKPPYPSIRFGDFNNDQEPKDMHGQDS